MKAAKICTSPPPAPVEGEVRFKRMTTPCEWIELYEPGGYHPVHIGDLMKDAQYKVLRKLGEGSYSTVWLAIDQKHDRFTALKVLTAAASTKSKELIINEKLGRSTLTNRRRFIVPMLDHFQQTGPNGVHTCLAFEPMGSSAHVMSERVSPIDAIDFRYPVPIAKRLLEQALQALAFLHANNITHGDFQPGNILFTLQDLSKVSESELLQDDKYRGDDEWEEESVSGPVERLDGKPDPWAPRYLAVAQPLNQYTIMSPDFQVMLSDLGEAFCSSDPPEKVATPIALRAPEIIFGQNYSDSLDIWSFGCVFFEFITGQPLFVVPGLDSMEEEDDTHLLQFNDVLGPLPDHLFSLWTRSSMYFDKNRILYNRWIGGAPDGEDPLGPKAQLLEQYFDRVAPADMTEEDATAIKSLLRFILQYDPVERPSAERILQNPWFSSQEERDDIENYLPERKIVSEQ